jgi:hypothetical protein
LLQDGATPAAHLQWMHLDDGFGYFLAKQM